MVWECEPDVDGEGSLGCPRCNAVVRSEVDGKKVRKVSPCSKWARTMRLLRREWMSGRSTVYVTKRVILLGMKPDVR